MPCLKLVIYVPVSHADQVRSVLGEAGAGVIGDYSFCSFSMRGVGRFLPGNHASPFIGKAGQFESVEEERIEVTCPESIVDDVIRAVRAVHPYEEMAYDVYLLRNEK